MGRLTLKFLKRKYWKKILDTLNKIVSTFAAIYVVFFMSYSENVFYFLIGSIIFINIVLTFI